MKNALLFKQKGAFCLFILFFVCSNTKSYCTAWTTASAGAIGTLSNWTNGTSSPTSFTTPGDTWTVTMSMTIAAGGSWTVGTASMTAVTVTFATGGTLNCGGAGFSIANVIVYGNVVNSGGTISRSGSGGTGITMDIFGNYNMTAGTVDASGSGSGCVVMNVHGNFTQSGGDVHRGGSGTTADTVNVWGNYSMTGGTVTSGGSGSGNVNINVYGNFSVSGTSAMTYTAAGPGNIVHLKLPSGSGTMMIDNTSTGTWSKTNIYIDTNCTAQLAGNFSTTTGTAAYGLTVDGTLICPAAYVVNGTRMFLLNGVATLIVGHATGVNGAITTTGTRTFSNSANYGFNGTAAQVTGTDMPATLVAPDTIIINNSAGVTLSQTTSTTGTLSFTSGILNTGSYTMSVPGASTSVQGAGTSTYVNGTLIKTITGLTSVNFEVGDMTYAPMLLTLSAAGTAGSFSLKAYNGLHPNVATSGFSSTHIANHYWTIGNLSAAGPATVIPKGGYESSDIIGGVNYYFRTQEYKVSVWLSSPLVSTNTVSPYTTAPNTGIALASLAGDYIYGTPIMALNVATTEKPEMTLYPNPSSGTFTVSLAADNSQEAQVIITDVFGKTVKTMNAFTNKAIDISIDVPAGVYLLSAHTATGKYLARVVIR